VASEVFSEVFKKRPIRGVGFSRELWPWKYLREGGAMNQWKICNWKLKTWNTLHPNRRERYSSFAQIWLTVIAHEKIQDLYHINHTFKILLLMLNLINLIHMFLLKLIPIAMIKIKKEMKKWETLLKILMLSKFQFFKFLARYVVFDTLECIYFLNITILKKQSNIQIGK
jgi:hypothetical protein